MCCLLPVVGFLALGTILVGMSAGFESRSKRAESGDE